MPTYPHIEHYYEDKQRLIEFGGSDNEQSIRAAFQFCLDSYCRDHREKLALVPELRTLSGIIPDGTVKDTLRLARGYWEAKDTHDDLDIEIQKKLYSGYPTDNIIFEDSQTAVLMQHGTVSMRIDMEREADLHKLIRTFLDYELPEVQEFREAWQKFLEELPGVLDDLRRVITDAESENVDYRTAAYAFLDLCRKTIGPAVSDADVREMLLQHILTKDIFLRVFAEDQFHRENNIARQLDALERTFFTGDVRREAIDRLRTYYGAIGRAADEIGDYGEKQQFLKGIYEDFYKVYNPAAADRLGVVYTPNEVVDFIIRGADNLLQKHFGRRLADDNVQILDPATGTGTFITSLIEHLPPERLEYKYRNELHANEVAILPYYIANLNIEYSYKEKMGRYLEFPNLCFVDTLDNLDWKGVTDSTVPRQQDMNLGGLSEENWIRIQEQNEKPISVIIGNPPYNDQQSNWYELNPNRQYPAIDKRIRDTYIKEGTAQRTHQYDMYKRFLRWASDRLADDGIIGFVSNSAFLASRQDDGFRKVVANEFNELWVMDLKGNARTRGDRRRREAGNIFEDKIRVGIAVYFLVRKKGTKGFNVFYKPVDDYARSSAKIGFIKGKDLGSFEFDELTPDASNNWLEPSNSHFGQLVPLANRQTKLAKTVDDEQALFMLYSVGISTNRDDWVYDFDPTHLIYKVRAFIDVYEESRAKHGGNDVDDALLDKTIKWTRDLKRQLQKNIPNTQSDTSVRGALYRPFTSKYLYYNQNLNEMQYQMPQIFPHNFIPPNKVICFPGNAPSDGFHALATDTVYSHDLLKTTQCLPLYRYTDDGERMSNITQWGLKRINEHYRKEFGEHFQEMAGGDAITAEDIFHYTYAVLHDPVYRHDYRVDLLREFPRLPLYRDFDAWKRMGKELMDLHIGFETALPYPLKRVEKSLQASLEPIAAKAILSANKERGIIRVDEQTTLVDVPPDAWRYTLGSRSALDWILDQYKERKPKDPTIAEKFNTYKFSNHKEKVIDLLMRVCTVSVETMKIVDSMAYWDEGELIVFGDRDKHEWSTMGLEAMLSEPEDEEWLAAWNEA